MIKPIIEEIDIWANSPDAPADVTEPTPAEKDKGWEWGQKPPYTYVNYLQNQTDSALAIILQNGIPPWGTDGKTPPLEDLTHFKEGARVLHEGIMYSALKDNYDIKPGTDVLTWDTYEERGGLLWNSSFEYKIGDIATDIGLVYTALVDNVGVTPASDDTKWQSAVDSVPAPPIERGGLLWDTTDYVIGDIISYNNSIYVCIQDAPIGTATPDIAVSFWKIDVVTIIDNLTSTSSTEALSANQGKILQDTKIKADSYSTSTVGGTVKMRVNTSTNTLYIRNDGGNA